MNRIIKEIRPEDVAAFKALEGKRSQLGRSYMASEGENLLHNCVMEKLISLSPAALLELEAICLLCVNLNDYRQIDTIVSNVNNRHRVKDEYIKQYSMYSPEETENNIEVAREYVYGKLKYLGNIRYRYIYSLFDMINGVIDEFLYNGELVR